jgi:hypothetical protein
MPPVPIEQQSPYPSAPPATSESDWMTPTECARHRRCSESCQNKERVRGDGPPYIKVRKRMIRYSRRAVDEWLAKQTRRSTSEPPHPAEQLISRDIYQRSKAAASGASHP